jgi:hypothetical protein
MRFQTNPVLSSVVLFVAILILFFNLPVLGFGILAVASFAFVFACCFFSVAVFAGAVALSLSLAAGFAALCALMWITAFKVVTRAFRRK